MSDTCDDIPRNALVVVPAHGISPSARAEALARGMNLVDTTCPLVQAAHAAARRFADSGDHVVVIGRSTHAALSALAAQAPGSTEIVETIDDVLELDLDPTRVSYVVQPGTLLEESTPIVAALRARYPHARGAHPDGFCYAATDRAASIRAVTGVSEIVLVLAEPGSADDTTDPHSKAYHLADLPDLNLEYLAGIGTVGLVTTSSAKPGLHEEVVAALSGLGPLSVVHQHFTSRVGTNLPRAEDHIAPPAQAPNMFDTDFAAAMTQSMKSGRRLIRQSM